MTDTAHGCWSSLSADPVGIVVFSPRSKFLKCENKKVQGQRQRQAVLEQSKE